jgi:hypothetical protein
MKISNKENLKMKRTVMVATLLALVALVVFTVSTFAQGPLGSGMMVVAAWVLVRRQVLTKPFRSVAME